MPRSIAAKEMNELQFRLRPFLEQHGFRMRSRTCNCRTSDGLTHVINFQMGRADPPGTSYIPWFRKNLYGKFTVNIGVYVPEVFCYTHAKDPSSFVAEADCCMRVRLGNLGPEHKDLWWKIQANTKMIAELQLRLRRDAIPFLARFGTRDDLLDELGKIDEAYGPGAPPRVTRAIILAHRGQKETAREVLVTQAIKAARADHTEYLKRLADRLGLEVLNI